MKRLCILIVAILFILAGCSNTVSPKTVSEDRIRITDSTGNEVSVIPSPKTVVALSASLAELWLEAGGKIAGTTSDTLEQGRLDTSLLDSVGLGSIVNIGSIKDPSAELVLSLKPDLVILSSTVSGQLSVSKVLEEAKVPYYFVDADSFLDYLEVFKDFTDITGRSDLYDKFGAGQKADVEKLIDAIPDGVIPTALVLRAYSSGVKAKGDGTVLTSIVDGLGVTNIAAGDTALTENLSLEKVVEDNPDYIFIVYMGEEEEETDKFLEQNLYSDPVWGTLSAVREGRMIVLPQELFHYKPNDRWGEAYAYLFKILYAE